MPVVPGSITQARWRASGTADAYVSVPAGLLNVPEITINDDELPTATYRDRAAGFRKAITMGCYDWSLFAALNALQVARTPIELEFTLTNGDIYTYDPVVFTVRPTIGAIPHIGTVYVADNGVTTDPTSTPLDWTALGSILNGSSLEMQAVSAENGYGQPFYKHASLRHEMFLLGNAAAAPETTLATYENALCTISLLHPDGNYTRYNSVFAQTRNNPDFSEEGFVTHRLTVDAIAQDVLTILTLQTTPPDYINGWELTGACFGYAESDFLTIS